MEVVKWKFVVSLISLLYGNKVLSTQDQMNRKWHADYRLTATAVRIEYFVWYWAWGTTSRLQNQRVLMKQSHNNLLASSMAIFT